MQMVLAVFYIGCLTFSIACFLNLLDKAFAKGFLNGLQCILFPVGTYYFCRKYWDEIKGIAFPMSISIILTPIGFLIHWLVK